MEIAPEKKLYWRPDIHINIFSNDRSLKWWHLIKQKHGKKSLKYGSQALSFIVLWVVHCSFLFGVRNWLSWNRHYLCSRCPARILVLWISSRSRLVHIQHHFQLCDGGSHKTRFSVNHSNGSLVPNKKKL